MGRDGRHRHCWRLPGSARVRPFQSHGANATHEGAAVPAGTPCPPGRGVGERPAHAAEVTCTGWAESQAQEPPWGLLLPPVSCRSHRMVTIQWRPRGFTPTSCSFRAIDLFGCHTRDLPLSGSLLWSMGPFSISLRQVEQGLVPPRDEQLLPHPKTLWRHPTCCSARGEEAAAAPHQN